MQSRRLDEGPPRTYAVVLNTDEDVLACLQRFVEAEAVTAAGFTGLGAFSGVVLGYFDWETKDYRRIPIDEQVEVLALTGNVALADGRPKLHPHVVVGKADGSAHGGHLLAARVRPTLEVVVTETPAHLRRRTDPETGLPLICMTERTP